MPYQTPAADRSRIVARTLFAHRAFANDDEQTRQENRDTNDAAKCWKLFQVRIEESEDRREQRNQKRQHQRLARPQNLQAPKVEEVAERETNDRAEREIPPCRLTNGEKRVLAFGDSDEEHCQ